MTPPVAARLAACVCLAAITVAPFLAIAVPGLGDTLNHAARMHVLAAIDTSPWLRQFYEVRWAPVPYLAMDAVVPALARLMPLMSAVRLFVAACVLMPAAGVAALHYVVHRRISLVPAVALLLGANTLLALGFLNCLFSFGCAMVLFALWVAGIAWPRPARIAFFLLAATALYLGHAFAFLGYGCAVIGFEAQRALRAGLAPLRRVAADLLTAGVQALPACGLALSLDAGQGGTGQLYSVYGAPLEKLLALFSPLLFATDPLQLGLCVVYAAVLAALAPSLRLDPRIWPAALVAGLAAAAMPQVLLAEWLTDLRLPLFTAMLLLGGLSLAPGSQARLRLKLALLLAALLAVKSNDVWRTLRILDGQAQEMARILQSVPPGARLLLANESAGPDDPAELGGATIWNMPLLAVITRDAFVPTLFTGLTTVHVRPPVAAISTPQGEPATLAWLASDLAGEAPRLSPAEQRESLKIYWHGWTAQFHYLLVEHFHARLPAPLPGALPAHLTLVAQTANLALYRVGG